MHHTPAQIPTGMSYAEAKKFPGSSWYVQGQEETYSLSCSSRLAYLDFMDQWRWLALNSTD